MICDVKSKMKRDLYIEDLRPANLTKKEQNTDTANTAANFITPKVSHTSNIYTIYSYSSGTSTPRLENINNKHYHYPQVEKIQQTKLLFKMNSAETKFLKINWQDIR